MARTINFNFTQGGGSTITEGTLTFAPTQNWASGTSVVVPSGEPIELVGGAASIPNVEPTPAAADGWRYQVQVETPDRRVHSWVVAVPAGTTPIDFRLLPIEMSMTLPLGATGTQLKQWIDSVHSHAAAANTNSLTALGNVSTALSTATEAKTASDVLTEVTETGRLSETALSAAIGDTAGISVRAYGARGDGLSDDTAAIQAALNQAASRGVPTIFPAGIYRISARIVPPNGSVISGYGATLKLVDGITPSWNILSPSNDSSMEVRGLSIDGNRANTTAPASTGTQGGGVAQYLTGAGTTGILRDMHIVNCHGPGVRMGGTRDLANPLNLPVRNGSIESITVEDCERGIHIDAMREIVLKDVTIRRCDFVGILEQHGVDVRVDNPLVEDTKYGHGILWQYSYGFKVSNGKSYRNGLANTTTANIAAQGFCCGGGQPSYFIPTQWSLSNCESEGNFNYGFSVDPTLIGEPGVVKRTEGTITGGSYSNNGHAAYAISTAQEGGSGIYLHNASGIVVTGTKCHNNLRAGIVDDGLDNVVTGFSVEGNGMYGVERRCASTETKGRGLLGQGVYRSNGRAFTNGRNLYISTYSIPGDIALPNMGRAIKTSDYAATTNSIGTSPDPELVVNLNPGTYLFTAKLDYTGPNSLEARIGWTVPSGTVLAWDVTAPPITATTVTEVTTQSLRSSGSTFLGSASLGTVEAATATATVRGVFTLVNPGNVTLMFSKLQSTEGAVILKAKSFVKFELI